MSVNAASILLVVCSHEAEARFLARTWSKTASWCGIMLAHWPAEIHFQRMILALSYGGNIKPAEVPAWVEEVSYFPGCADFSAVRNRLWPKTFQNGNAHPEVKFTNLFVRKEADK